MKYFDKSHHFSICILRTKVFDRAYIDFIFVHAFLARCKVLLYFVRWCIVYFRSVCSYYWNRDIKFRFFNKTLQILFFRRKSLRRDDCEFSRNVKNSMFDTRVKSHLCKQIFRPVVYTFVVFHYYFF